MLFEYSVARNDIVIPATRASRLFVCSSILQDLVLLLTTVNFDPGAPPTLSRYCDVDHTSLIGEGFGQSRSNTFFRKYTNVSNIIPTNISITDCSAGMMLTCISSSSRRGYFYVEVAILSKDGPHIEVTVSLLETATKPAILPPSRTTTIKLVNDVGSYIISNNAIIMSLSSYHLMFACKNYITFYDAVTEAWVPGAFYQSGCVVGQYKISNYWYGDSRIANKLNFVFIKLGFKVPTNVDPVGQSLEVFDVAHKVIANVDVNPMINNFIWRTHINLNLGASSIVSTPDIISDGSRNKSDWMYPLRLISLKSTEYITLEQSNLLFASGQIGYCGDVVVDDQRRYYLVFPVNSTTGQPILYSADTNTAEYPKILLPMY